MTQKEKINLPKKEKVLILRFSNRLHHNELALLRGAINELLKEKSNVLYHNHEGETFRYSYPLIQYKRINQQAALVCINQGTEAIGLLLMHGNFACQLGDKKVELEIDNVKANQFIIQTWDSMFYYNIRKWLALNQVNYLEYCKLDSLSDKCLFLEKILIGNILSMGKGIDIQFDKEIICKITNIIETTTMSYKNVKMMSFDVEFKSNVSLPDYIGIGKGTSLGFGMIASKRETKK
ncbi:MAG: CRISPR-associated endonuclease Cas6 [Paludibacter sp.]|nr:CRISPR-associated endonuclease Cas6 [Paludibacter sp.]